MADQRPTKLKGIREGWEHIIAAHYYYKLDGNGRSLGYKTIGDLFKMPKPTIQRIVKRNPQDSLEVRLTAIQWGLLNPSSYAKKGD